MDHIYNKSFTKQVPFLSVAEIQTLEPGTYTAIVQYPGKNTIFEVGYSKVVGDIETKEELTSPWVGVPPTDVFGSQPRSVMLELKKRIATTDDTFKEYRIEVANPIIEMVSVDETYQGGKDVLDIRGYTNVAKGTGLAFVMDKDKQSERTIRANTYMETVQGNVSNQWRYFQVIIPIDYETIPVGQHFITASTVIGGSQTIPFYVYDLPAGQETPNATIKYVAGDIFVAPVTVAITVPVPGPTQTILVPVTPPNEQVYAQQKIILDQKQAEKDAQDFMWRVAGLFGVIVVGCTLYGIRVVKKARLR